MKIAFQLLAALSVLLSCRATLTPPLIHGEPGSPAMVAGLSVTEPPYAEVHANWKERLRETYVFVEHHGDYRRVGDAMRELFERCQAQGVQPTGAPFALFFDDPGRTPVDQLESRACLPVDPAERLPEGLQRDVLPSSMVAYAVVAGAYPEVPRAYPGLFSYLDERGWARNGPLREIYLVDPGQVESYRDLRTEVQVPWVVAR